MGLRDLLLVPDRFFQEKSKDEEHLKSPVLLVGIIGVLSAISAYFVTQVTVQTLLQALPSDAQGIAGIMVPFAIIGGILGAYLLWLVATVVFFGLSALFHGTGSFRRTLEFIGYGFMPQIFGGLISIYFMYEFASTVTIPRITDPMEIAQAVQSLMANPNFMLATIVGILFLLWSANIWIFGLKYARNLNTRQAAISVIVPVTVYVLYSLSSTGVMGGLLS